MAPVSANGVVLSLKKLAENAEKNAEKFPTMLTVADCC
jgi:hypothetical protein